MGPDKAIERFAELCSGAFHSVFVDMEVTSAAKHLIESATREPWTYQHLRVGETDHYRFQGFVCDYKEGDLILSHADQLNLWALAARSLEVSAKL